MNPNRKKPAYRPHPIRHAAVAGAIATGLILANQPSDVIGRVKEKVTSSVDDFTKSPEQRRTEIAETIDTLQDGEYIVHKVEPNEGAAEIAKKYYEGADITPLTNVIQAQAIDGHLQPTQEIRIPADMVNDPDTQHLLDQQ